VGLRVVGQGGARRGRRVGGTRAASRVVLATGASPATKVRQGVMPSYSPPFPSCCGRWVYLCSDLIVILLIPSVCSSYWVYMCTPMSYASNT
jgi:hypothetical protein